jgi:hypothetical protein
MIVIPGFSEHRQLEMLLNRRAPEDLTLRLYTNKVAVHRRSALGEIVELTGHGYRPRPLAALDWALADEGDRVVATQPKVTWTFEDGEAVTVFGFYMTWQASGILAWLEPMKRPQTIEFEGDNVTVVPRYSLRGMT